MNQNKPNGGNHSKGPKLKVVEIALAQPQLKDLERSRDRGVLNLCEPIWLTAFAAYNVENKVRLSMEFAHSYDLVYQFIKGKLS